MAFSPIHPDYLADSPLSPRRSAGIAVLLVTWGVLLAFIVLGIALLVLSHGHLSGVQDNADEAAARERLRRTGHWPDH